MPVDDSLNETHRKCNQQHDSKDAFLQIGIHVEKRKRALHRRKQDRRAQRVDDAGLADQEPLRTGPAAQRTAFWSNRASSCVSGTVFSPAPRPSAMPQATYLPL